MKKLVNLLALFVLVSANVLTPLSYVQAQENPDVWGGDITTPQGDDNAGDTTPDDETQEPQSWEEWAADNEVPQNQANEPNELEQHENQEWEQQGNSGGNSGNEQLIPIIIDSVQNANEESEILQEGNEDDLPQSWEGWDTWNLREAPEISNDISMTYADNVVTYIDSEWNEFEMWSITITDWNNSITMLDRNLWATATWGTDAYWYHFQWWNNYGFDWKTVQPHEPWQVDAEGYQWNHPYLSGVFLKQNQYNWDSSNNPELWWGIEQGMPSVWYMMQWPCPVWYHVPSIDEWATVLEMYHNMNSKWSILSGEFPAYEVEDIAFRKSFQDAFYIPFAWLRNNDYHLKDQWTVARFWTATPSDSDESKARRFYLDKNRVDSLTGNYRVFWYSVRCFQDTDNADTVTVYFDTRWWNTIPSKLLEKWTNWFEPSTPIKEGDKFLWWFLDEGLTNAYDSYSSIDGNTTLYAMWRSDVIIYEDKATTYTDTLGNVFDMWSITVSNWNYSITILDRNLGATWTWWEDAYWYHFQWWNNYGFPWYDEIELGNEPVSASEYYRKSPYVSNKFIIWWEYWDESDNKDLWWDTTDLDYSRQWPCPDWYHVPSVYERDDLISLYSEVWWYRPAVALLSASSSSTSEFKEDFQETFNIPLANRRNYSDGKIQSLWEDARIWSSTPKDDWEKAWRFYLGWVTVDTSYNQRAYWYSVRCFKNTDDSNNVVLSYEVNWWTAIQAQTLPKWETWYLPWYTTSKQWDELLGWYSDVNMTIPFDFDSELNEDTTIYAKWALSYTVIFKDWDGSIIKREVVHQWESATVPEDPSRDWYKFKWWDKPINNITEDSEINAIYEKIDSWSWWHSWWWGGWWGGNKPSSQWDEPTADSQWNKETSEPQGEAPAENKDSQGGDHNSTTDENAGESSHSWDDSDWIPPEENTEMREAYSFAYGKWITTQSTYEEAKVDKKLTRIEMAKMLSQYAINVMWSEPDETRYNKFADVSDTLDAEYNDAVTLAYELWIMWINMPNNEFRPKDYVTRWEFATALSRMVYWTSDGKYRQTSKYYTLHIEKLESERVLTQVDPAMMERRWYVMIMLMRLATKI